MTLSRSASDWLLVTSCLLSLLAAVAYFFYSNRLLALLIQYVFRINWWTGSQDRAWVSLESFQLSLLSGRIMIKDLRYYSSNQSFRAVKCSIVWRYWIWRTRNGFLEAPSKYEEGLKESSKQSKLPSRIHIALEGAEWHFYNRTSAFNDILSNMQRTAKEKDGSSIDIFTSRSETDKGNVLSPHETISSMRIKDAASKVIGFKDKIISWVAALQPELYEVLPIDISVLRGAILFGNDATARLLVAKFSAGDGSYSMLPSRSSCDKYKIVIDASFQDAKVDLERNHRYRGPLSNQGRVIAKRLGRDEHLDKLGFSTFRDIWSSTKRREAVDKIEDMHFRMEFREQETQNHYAVVETILETPRLQLSYYWDTPGTVPLTGVKDEFKSGIHPEIGNGDLSPQFGMDVVVHGGIIRYGPWADRQRFELQRIFFPATYRTNTPTGRLNPGDTRIYTEMKIFIELRDTTTLHIPFREPSKDWQYDEHKFPGVFKKRREAGWIEIHAGGNSTINYVLPWVATPNGYDVLMQLHLDEVTILSSVNEMRLLSATSAKILCEMPTPLHWNDFRHWIFDVSLQTPTLHIIRDHIHLFTDLGKDWVSGPPSDFDKWIPMHYTINVAIRDFELNLYLNDQNLITRAHARDANSILSFRGKTLRNAVEIPANTFRPPRVKYPFWVESPNVNLVLTLPKWNTHAVFASSRTTDFGAVRSFRLDGSFLSHSEVLADNIDQLKLGVTGSDVVFFAFGWVVRSLMCVRDDYFGNFTHFSTLDEYVYKREHNINVGDPVELKWKEGRSNVFEVTLDVLFHRNVIILPAGLTGYEYSVNPSLDGTSSHATCRDIGTSIVLLQPEFQLYLRTQDYSMEMDVRTSPIKLSIVDNLSHSLSYESFPILGRRKLHLNGLSILAHRLFGPQPRTSTYVCLWEFNIGDITGVISLMEIQNLLSAITSFRLNFVDAINAPAAEFALPSDPDVTFLKVDLKFLDVALNAGKSMVQLFLQDGVKFDYNDLAGNHYKKMTELRIPIGILRGLLNSEINPEQWYEAGSVSFDLAMDTYFAPANWQDLARKQREFISVQDKPARRVWYLYEPLEDRSSLRTSDYEGSMYLPQPALPGMRRKEKALHKTFQHHTHQNASLTYRTAESDEDERISEAHRDARLANSRPTTPLPMKTDFSDSASSGESDNEDYSDHGTDSDSDEAHREGLYGDAFQNGSPVLASYRHIVRKFESHLHDPYSHSPLFTIIRDPLAHWDDVPDFPSESSNTPSSSAANESLFLMNQDHTISAVQVNRVNVLFTPLCARIGSALIEDVTAYWRSSSIELLVDSLTAEFLSSAGLEAKVRSSRSDLIVEVSALQLHILQSLMTVGETLSPVLDPPSTGSVAISDNSRIVSDVVVTVYNSKASYSKTTTPDKQTSISFQNSFARLQSRLDVSIVHDMSPPSRNVKPVPQLLLHLNRSTLATFPSSVRADLGNLDFHLLKDTSVELLCATIEKLLRIFQDFQRNFVVCRKTCQTAQWRRIWGILQVSRAVTVEDPLSQIQPSYLVQTGRPNRLRYDPSWKLFMYLRHCLRLLGPSHRRTLTEMPRFDEVGLSPPLPQEISQLLQKTLVPWGYDLSLEEVMVLPFNFHCFRFIIPPSPTKADQKGGICGAPTFINFGVICVLVHCVDSVHSTNDGNEFIIGPLAVTHRIRRQTVAAHSLNKLQAIQPYTFDGDYFPVHHHVVTFSCGDIRFSFHPSFVIFLRHLLRVYSAYFMTRHEVSSSLPLNSRKALLAHHLWECFGKLSNVVIQAAVEGMVAEIGLDNMEATASMLSGLTTSHNQIRARPFTSGSCSSRFSELFIRVRQAQDKNKPFQFNEREVLASIVVSGASIHNGYRTLGDAVPTGNCLLAMRSLVISIPRSALLTYQMVEEWRVQYLPKIHAMSRDLVSELNKRHKQRTVQTVGTSARFKFPAMDFQFRVTRVGILLQVMHGTWFSWDVNNILGFLKSSSPSDQKFHFTYGVQLSDQKVKIVSHSSRDTSGNRTISFGLPAFEAAGNCDEGRIGSHAIIDKFSIHLKPEYMDDILVVQHNLGTHFYDVLDLISQNRAKRSPISRTKKRPFHFKYDIAFMLRGFRIDIDGPSSVLDLTSAEMTGTARNEPNLVWNFAVADLALGLSHHSGTFERRMANEFDRRFRTAYMVLDMKARSSSGSGLPYDVQGPSERHVLQLQISRMHAVMSPNSIGELGDLIDHIQAEKFIRQEQRAMELEEIKNKTQRVIRVFDVPKPESGLNRSASWLDKYMFKINVTDIGVAFPLKLKNEVEVDSIGFVPAFLVAINSAMLTSHGSHSGQASMESLSFLFTERFNQALPLLFNAEYHEKSQNKLIYPRMKARFHSVALVSPPEFHLAADVDGFKLHLDPKIVDNVFGLIDVYKRGKTRIEKLAYLQQRASSSSEAATAGRSLERRRPTATTILSTDTTYQSIKASHVLMTLTFHRGHVYLHHDHEMETVSFPRLTVWAEYRAKFHPKNSVEIEPSALLTFRTQVHSTVNEIQPSMLDFIIKVMNRLQTQLLVSEDKPQPSNDTDTVVIPQHEEELSSEINISHSVENNEFLSPGVLAGIQLSFSLRIDSSRLDILSDLDVGVSLVWQSGGFLVTLSPTTRTLQFAGSVTGMKVDLRHRKFQAGMVQTAHADVRGLSFSVSYSQPLVDERDRDSGEPLSLLPVLSVTVDTEFDAGFRFDRLQDILIMKAVYIDRIPVVSPTSAPKKPIPSSHSTENPTSSPSTLNTIILVRARQIKLKADLGHNIASASITFTSPVFTSRITPRTTDFTVTIAALDLDFAEDRPLGGFMRLPECYFTTSRVRSNVLEFSGGEDGGAARMAKMLDVTLGSGPLDVVLQSEKRVLLQYHAEPFLTHIADDWSSIDWRLPSEERILRLEFSVTGTDVLAIANLQCVPRIIMLLDKLRSDLQTQEKDAQAVLSASSMVYLPRPDNTLSEVADAMIRSSRAKTRSTKDSSYSLTTSSYTIVQRMDLQLSSIRIGLFRNPNDSEMALFQGRDVHAELERLLHSTILDSSPSRSLKLAFSSLYLSKYSSLKYYRAAGLSTTSTSAMADLLAVPWLERLLKGASEWTIARVPAMILEMNSDVEYEITHDGYGHQHQQRQEILHYDLVAAPDERRVQSVRSIYVSLNLSLYIWAGALVKGLGIEIEKALAASGFAGGGRTKGFVRDAAAAIAVPPTLVTSSVAADSAVRGVGAPASGGEATTAGTSGSGVGIAVSSGPGQSSAAKTTNIPEADHPRQQQQQRLPRKYHARSKTSIDYGTIQQLGEATPDAQAPWLGLKETVPPRVHEYATLPMEVLMNMLLEVYNKQLKMATRRRIYESEEGERGEDEKLEESVGVIGVGEDDGEEEDVDGHDAYILSLD